LGEGGFEKEGKDGEEGEGVSVTVSRWRLAVGGGKSSRLQNEISQPNFLPRLLFLSSAPAQISQEPTQPSQLATQLQLCLLS